ncbi:hypothetical protein R1CP_35800 (plasmid) [Rhodococcus opacus]|uniref:Uncharacterized protein n=1 Tax=Rhodococcus opacus TaxID=37919 RepID=A0A1B1KGN4_RHOOP|nr:hypothetical protein R1CP_35800 [Rhodococcus opacus]
MAARHFRLAGLHDRDDVSMEERELLRLTAVTGASPAVPQRAPT